MLQGKVALVTGGGKGLGRGVARRLAREGARIVIAEIDGDAAEATASEIEREFGAKALAITTDIADKDAAQAAVEQSVEQFGSIDILVNNASQLSANTFIETKTDAMLERVLKIALWGSWWTMQAAMPHMRDRGGGAIGNFYSIDAEAGAWLHADYNIAKSALLGLTRSAASEWGRYNIRVNAIAPTGLGTVFEQLARDIPGFIEAEEWKNPLGRVGDPEKDIGSAVLFLASELSSFVTGELLHVDGGQHLPRYNSKPMDFGAVKIPERPDFKLEGGQL